MKRQVGMVVEAPRNMGYAETMELMKDVGFDCIFSNQYDPEKVCFIKNKADQLGLDVSFLHAPYRGINNFWMSGLDYLPLKKTIYQTIDSASAAGIPMIVSHVDSGWNPPPMCEIGLKRFDDMVEYADKKNVKIAFENIRNFGTIAALVQRYRAVENVGFCYDCGHEHCYTRIVDFTSLFASKIICTHIHDNVGFDGRDDPDDHWLMFDGNMDYTDMVRRLDAVGYAGPLNVECRRISKYDDWTDEQFIRTAYERIKKISEL